jgi:hypothetical protein
VRTNSVTDATLAPTADPNRPMIGVDRLIAEVS